MLQETHADDMQQIVTRTQDKALTRRWAYYQGDHPDVYATPKLAQSFKELVGSMTENYCGLAVGARLSRLQITGWTGPDAETATGLWEKSRLGQRQDRLWRWALSFGTAWIAVTREGADTTLNVVPPTRMAGLRDPMDPNSFRVAGQVFQHLKGDGTPDKRRTITLYYPEETLAYEGEGADYTKYTVVEGSQSPGLGFVPAVDVAPYGDGPVLIDEISQSQDRINKLCSNKLVAAEFGAFRQRVFFTRQEVTNYDLRNAPDNAIVLDPDHGATRVQEMSVTELSNYDNSKTSEIDGLFTIAGLPRHMRVNAGANPSGEAIKADEMPLVEHLLNHQREGGEALVDLMRLLDVDAAPVWRNPVPAEELAEAQVVSEYAAVGVPWQTTVARYAGWSEEEILEASIVAPTGTEPTI